MARCEVQVVGGVKDGIQLPSRASYTPPIGRVGLVVRQTVAKKGSRGRQRWPGEEREDPVSEPFRSDD